MCQVIVGRTNQQGAIYVGRGSIFGNPWRIEETADEYRINRGLARDLVCNKFEAYFHETLKHKQEFKDEIAKIVANSVYGEDIILGCFCSPKRCHAETIKEHLEKELAKKHYV